MRRGLTIIVSGADRDRLRSALGLAAAEAALGGAVRLFFDAGAVALLADAGPLLATARELGASVIACQTGLAERGMALPEGVDGGGLVGLMAAIGEDRLVVV